MVDVQVLESSQLNIESRDQCAYKRKQISQLHRNQAPLKLCFLLLYIALYPIVSLTG